MNSLAVQIILGVALAGAVMVAIYIANLKSDLREAEREKKSHERHAWREGSDKQFVHLEEVLAKGDPHLVSWRIRMILDHYQEKP